MAKGKAKAAAADEQPPGWMRRPVSAWVKGGYSICRLEECTGNEPSPETLIHCILNVRTPALLAQMACVADCRLAHVLMAELAGRPCCSCIIPAGHHIVGWPGLGCSLLLQPAACSLLLACAQPAPGLGTTQPG